ncbi:MAG: hypothetical protein ACRDUY_06215 [Nitriliruptorales bacterium]
MRLSWFADFFRAIPEALRALYYFGDPSTRGDGWWGFVILAIWGVFLIALPLAIALRSARRGHEWVAATMGSIGGLGVLWWVFGILPSAFIYYVAGAKQVLADRVIPTSLTVSVGGVFLPIATNLYDVIRDTVVVVWHLVALVGTVVAALQIQKRFPRNLGPGEERREAGGYK